jgi:glycine betaine/proline transport system substrate-binding protein
VAQFLKQVSFEVPTLNDWILKITDKQDPAVIAKEWVAANPEKVNAWLVGIKAGL